MWLGAIWAKMVGVPGLEPGTSPLSGVHSNQLSYTPLVTTMSKNTIGDLGQPNSVNNRPSLG